MQQSHMPPPFYKSSYGARILGVLCGVFAISDYGYSPIVLFFSVGIGALVDILIMNYYAPRRAQKLVNQRVSADVVALCAKMCKAKGQVKTEDIVVYNRIFEFKPTEIPLVRAIFNQERSSTQGFEVLAARIVRGVGGHKPSLELVMEALFSLALSDGYIQEKEQIFILRVAEVFGFSLAKLTAIEESVRTQERKTNWQNTTTSTTDALVEAYQTLGLPVAATPADVKKKYRKLAAEYHPDRQHHKNPSEVMRKKAEEKLAEINTAYQTILKKSK